MPLPLLREGRENHSITKPHKKGLSQSKYSSSYITFGQCHLVATLALHLKARGRESDNREQNSITKAPTKGSLMQQELDLERELSKQQSRSGYILPINHTYTQHNLIYKVSNTRKTLNTKWYFTLKSKYPYIYIPYMKNKQKSLSKLGVHPVIQ